MPLFCVIIGMQATLRGVQHESRRHRKLSVPAWAGTTEKSNMKIVQTIARAYQQIYAGEESWIALGNFRNAWYGYAKDNRLALVDDPIAEPEQNTEYTRRWGPSAPPQSISSAIAIAFPVLSGYIIPVTSSQNPGGLSTPIISPPVYS